MRSFIHDDRAAMEIPLRLVVYVIISAMILMIAAIGLQNIRPLMVEDTLEKQVGDIRMALTTMQHGAARNLIDPDSAAGNMRIFKIILPDDSEYLAFGVDPDPDNDGNLTDTKENLLTERGNVIFYKSRTGGKTRVPLEDPIELREGLLENGRWVVNNRNEKQYGIVITGGGRFEITFEQVYDPFSKERYTLSHYTDGLEAYINPYDPAVLPNSVWVTTSPNSIPADGKTSARVVIQLKDKKGRDAAKDGVEINLTTTLGNLGATNLTTIKGRAVTDITSDIFGTAMITASSPGLNPGSTYLTIKRLPIIFEIKKWINDSKPLNITFSTAYDLEYSVYFSGSGTEALWEWPQARIEIDGILVGEETIDSPDVIMKTYPGITIPSGDHTLSIKMTNDFFIPWIMDRNLYVESVRLTE